MADRKKQSEADLVDPEVDSEFARSKAKSKARGTRPGVDPDTGERGAILWRELYNDNGGDAKKATADFKAIAKAGGYGEVELDQALDIRGLERSIEENKSVAERGVDMQGRPIDLYAKRQLEQQAQHQDNLWNDVQEAIRKAEKG